MKRTYIISNYVKSRKCSTLIRHKKNQTKERFLIIFFMTENIACTAFKVIFYQGAFCHILVLGIFFNQIILELPDLVSYPLPPPRKVLPGTHVSSVVYSAAYKHADGKKIDGRRVLVDVERGRTVKGWLPRRLGTGRSTKSVFNILSI